MNSIDVVLLDSLVCQFKCGKIDMFDCKYVIITFFSPLP
jgi:hypothetical protein